MSRLIESKDELEHCSDLTEPTPAFYEDLVQILCVMSQWHGTHSRGFGSIGEGSLKRDKDGNCVIDFTPREESLCESLRKTDPESQRFINVGREPEPIDDLVSLGVVAAELTVPPANRPAIEPTGDPYWKKLAGALKTSPWKFGVAAKRDRLIHALLTGQERGVRSVADCMRHRGIVLMSKSDGSVGSATSSQLLWSHRKAIAVLAASVLISCLLAWMLAASHAQVATLEAANQQLGNENEKLGDQGDALEKETALLAAENTRLREELDGRGERLSPNSVPTAPLKLLAKRYHNDSPFWDQKSRRILDERKALQADFNYVHARLLTFNEASKQWWRWVSEGASKEQIDLEMDGCGNEVRSILGIWRGKLAKAQTYDVSVRRLVVPKADSNEHYDIWIGEAEQTVRIEDGVLKPVDCKNRFRLRWGYGQHINVLVEERGMTYDADVLADNLNGALSIFRLATETIMSKDKKYQVAFRVKGLTGPPPYKAIGSLPQPKSTDEGSSEEPGASNGTVPIDPIGDLLK